MLLTTLLLTTCLSPAPEANLEWFGGPFMSAIGSARSTEKPVLVYFWSGQSEQCRALWETSLSKPDAADILAGFTMFSADTATKPGYSLVERFGITTLPTLLILDAEGNPNDVILGAINLPNLNAEIQRIQRGEGTLNTLRASVEKTPTDIEARGKYAVKLNDLGMTEAFQKQRSEIYGMDPKFANATTAEFRKNELQRSIELAAGDEGNFEVEPLIRFLGSIEHMDVKYTGWGWIAAVADYKEDRPAGRAARMSMWENVPAANLAREGFSVSQHFYGMREDLSKEEKRFALHVAEQTLAAVEAWSDKANVNVVPLPEGASKDSEAGEACASTCPADCLCDGCSEGCVGEGERLAERKLYVARASENLALILHMNGKRKDALATIGRALELDPENATYLESQAAIKKRG